MPVGTPEKLIKLEEYGFMIDNEYDELIAMKIEARGLIEEVKNHTYKTLLEEYYLLHKSQRKIASRIYMSRTDVSRKLQLAVEEFDEVYPYKQVGTNGTHCTVKT